MVPSEPMYTVEIGGASAAGASRLRRDLRWLLSRRERLGLIGIVSITSPPPGRCTPGFEPCPVRSLLPLQPLPSKMRSRSPWVRPPSPNVRNPAGDDKLTTPLWSGVSLSEASRIPVGLPDFKSGVRL